MAMITIGQGIRLFNLNLPSWVREHLVGTTVRVIETTRENYVVRLSDLLNVLERGNSRQRGVWFWLTYIARSAKEQISLPRAVCTRLSEASSGGGIMG